MSPQTETEYIPLDDESEAARVNGFRGNRDARILTDEDVRMYSLTDFGLNINNEVVTDDVSR